MEVARGKYFFERGRQEFQVTRGDDIKNFFRLIWVGEKLLLAVIIFFAIIKFKIRR